MEFLEGRFAQMILNHQFLNLYLSKNKPVTSIKILHEAVETDNKALFKYIALFPKKGINVKKSRWKVCTKVVESGNLNMLRYLHDHGYYLDSFTTMAAAKQNNLEMLQWLHFYKCFISSTASYYAIKYKNKDMFNWLFKNNLHDGNAACTAAVDTNDLQKLKWLYKKGMKASCWSYYDTNNDTIRDFIYTHFSETERKFTRIRCNNS
jgi:hypothetical protein